MNRNQTYQVFYIRNTGKRRITGMDEVEAATPAAAIEAAHARSEHSLTVTDLIVKKRGYWQQVVLTPDLLAAAHNVPAN